MEFFVVVIVGGVIAWMLLSRATQGRADKGRPDPGAADRVPTIDIPHTGEEVSVVGESHYQANFEIVLGLRKRQSTDRECEAELVCEDNNRYDEKAVFVALDGHKVGYLSKEDARRYRARYGNINATCLATVVGGWDRGKDDNGMFGIRLDLPL